MSLQKVNVTVYTPHSLNDLISGLSFGRKGSLKQLLETLGSASGPNATVDMSISNQDAVDATGTITISGVLDGDTITVGTTVFTAKSSGASGSTQFNIGGSDANAAINAAAAISAHPALNANGVGIFATANNAVLTVIAVGAGITGNSINLAMSAHGTVVAMSGGANETKKVSFIVG